MAQVKRGDKVKVHYTGRLGTGEVFDSSECGEDECGCGSGPLEFTVGSGEVIPGFDNALLGMAPGESKTVVIPKGEAYGDHMEEMVAHVNRAEIPPNITPVVGQQLEVVQEGGQTFQVTITEVTDTQVTLDANHPLAGRDLTFDLRLVEIC